MTVRPVLYDDVRTLIEDMREVGKFGDETAEEALDLLEEGEVSKALETIKPYFV